MPERYVDVSHEALIRGWPRLRGWLDEDRAGLRLHRRITQAANEWQRSNRDDELLYRGTRLAQAQEWRERNEAELNPLEREFLEASVALKQSLEQEKEERQRRELEQAQALAAERERSAHRLRIGLAFVAVLAVVAVGAASWAIQQQAQANNARDQADGLINFMLIDLRDKLIPIGRLNILDDVAKKAKEYLDRLPKKLVTPPRLRQQGVLLGNVGDVLSSQGELDEALKAYQQTLEIFKKLAEQEPINASWQSDLSNSYERVGDLLRDQGDLAGALNSYRQSLTIREQLAKQDPGNAGWQRNLSVSYNKVGDVLVPQGKPEQALDLYQQGLTIAKRLAKQDQSNSDWQRDLSVSYNKVGDVLVAQGKLEQALDLYQQGLTIAKRLAKQDQSNSDWQRDLGVSYNHIGDVLRCQGKLNEARDAYQEWLSIARKLAEQDPANWIWQHDLGVSWERIGYVRQDQNDLTGAAEAYEFELQVFGKLSGLKPKDVGLETDYAESKLDLAGVHRLQGRKESALQLLEQAENTFIDLQKRAPLSAYQQQVLTRINKELSALKEAAD
jgi:tetratricopeptide (TPR) repeat protein